MTNFHLDTSFQNAKHINYRKAMVDTFVSAGFTHALTLQWNRSLRYERAMTDLKLVHAKVDRTLLGSRFHQNPNRTFAAFIFEGVENVNLHVHSYWKIPTPQAQKFEALIWRFDNKPNLWKSIVPSGSSHLSLLENQDAAAWYLTKEMSMRDESQRFVFSHELISSDAKIAALTA